MKTYVLGNSQTFRDIKPRLNLITRVIGADRFRNLPKGTHLQVLVVEDQPEYLELMKSLIEDLGHQVTGCRSAAEAWSHYKRTYFPLVVTDWVLLDRDMNGLKLCQSIRNHVNGKYSYLLLITGKADPGDLTAVLNSGADDYLTKSVDVHLLTIRLRVAINNGKNLSEYMLVETQKVVVTTHGIWVASSDQ